MKIAITGANGFIGKSLLNYLSGRYELYALSRRNKFESKSVNYINYDINKNNENLENILKDISVIIHTAARVHVKNDIGKDNFDKYELLNYESTIKIATMAKKLGVKKFIFLSTVAVYGEKSTEEFRFKVGDEENPLTSYSITKLSAERKLFELSKNTNLDVICLRIPLVYGPGAKGNIKTLIDLCKIGIPLPFGSVKNKRSYLYIGNLESFIDRCISFPFPINRTLNVSDNYDLSLSKLVSLVKKILNKNNFNFRVSPNILRVILFLVGKSNINSKLLDNFRVDISDSMNLLNWDPPYDILHGLNKTLND